MAAVEKRETTDFNRRFLDRSKLPNHRFTTQLEEFIRKSIVDTTAAIQSSNEEQFTAGITNLAAMSRLLEGKQPQVATDLGVLVFMMNYDWLARKSKLLE